MKKCIFAILLSFAAITSVYFCLDINNTISGMGISTQEINWDIASIVISNLVVISLYLITFNLLDSRQIKMSKNQREVALLLMFKTYEQCKGSVSLFELREAREKAVEKCDFDKVIFEDKQMQYYLDFPFEFHEQIIEFASTGTISKQEFSDYLELREAFRKHINIRIMSFDREELPNVTKREFLETYERVTNFLNRGENSARF